MQNEALIMMHRRKRDQRYLAWYRLLRLVKKGTAYISPSFVDVGISRPQFDLLSAIAKADSDKFRQLAEACTPAPRPDAHALKSLQTRVAHIAEELGIEPEIIATRRDLVATVLDNPPPHIAEGWRSSVLEAAL
jgi:ribonuclease D